jgi:hypothetical protein
VHFGPSSEQLGLAAVLLLSGLGFLAGAVPGSGPSPSRWGYDVIAARYMAARDPGDQSKSRLPRLPRGVLLHAGLLRKTPRTFSETQISLLVIHQQL